MYSLIIIVDLQWNLRLRYCYHSHLTDKQLLNRLFNNLNYAVWKWWLGISLNTMNRLIIIFGQRSITWSKFDDYDWKDDGLFCIATLVPADLVEWPCVTHVQITWNIWAVETTQNANSQPRISYQSVHTAFWLFTIDL